MGALLEHVPDHGFRRRPHNQRLLQLRLRVGLHALPVLGRAQPMVRHHGALLGKALNVLGLLAEKGDGDKEGEVGVLRARRLDPLVQVVADVLPQRHAVGLDHHAAAHRALIHQVGGGDHFLIPLREIGVARRDALQPAAAAATLAALAALLLLLLLLLLLRFCGRRRRAGQDPSTDRRAADCQPPHAIGECDCSRLPSADALHHRKRCREHHQSPAARHFQDSPLGFARPHWRGLLKLGAAEETLAPPVIELCTCRSV